MGPPRPPGPSSGWGRRPKARPSRSTRRTFYVDTALWLPPWQAPTTASPLGPVHGHGLLPAWAHHGQMGSAGRPTPPSTHFGPDDRAQWSFNPLVARSRP
eukprot:2958126-Pyramimonas_sp.AAC.1